MPGQRVRRQQADDSTSGLGRTRAKDTPVSSLVPPLGFRIPARKKGQRELVFGGLSLYIFDSRLPGHWDPKTYLSSRGGFADLVHRFNREEAGRVFLRARQDDVEGFAADRLAATGTGREADLEEARFPDAAQLERYVDLRPHLLADSPFTGRPWFASFRHEALRDMGWFAKDRPVRTLLFDYNVPAINSNETVLDAIGVKLPIRTWADFEAALERCQAHDYPWPIALFNAEKTPGIYYYSRAVQDMVMRGLAPKLDADGDSALSLADWKHALTLRRSDPQTRGEPRRTTLRRFGADTPAYVESLRILKRLSRHFVWYANRYDSLDVKPFFFSRRPQSLFRTADVRRVRADRDLYHYVHAGRHGFPFLEGAVTMPEITRETSRFASGPPRGQVVPASRVGITRAAAKRRTLPAAVRFLQFFTEPSNYQFFLRWSWTLPAVRGTEAAPEVRALTDRLSREPQAVRYEGLSPEGRKRWFRGMQEMIEATGTVEEMIQTTREVVEMDREWLRRKE